MQTLGEIKAMLGDRGLRPRRSLGQNFLIDHNLLRILVDATGATEGDLVLEIGPGTGTLTDALLERGCRVVACELDRGLASLLRDRMHSWGDRFALVEGDCLARKDSLNPQLVSAVEGRRYSLVANLPYGVASPLMALLATRYPPGGASSCTGQFVTIQREVAQRLRAQPGSRDYGELSVVVQAMAEVSRIASVPASCFWPRPKVASEMVSIVPRAAARTSDPERLSQMCRLLFSRRRKKLSSILREARIELPAGVDPDVRPEMLSVEQIEELARTSTTPMLHHSE